MAETLTARDVKDKLYARHPGSASPMPGAWTVIEEWRNIDLLAFSAWSSACKYGRIGYEVKISRSDMRAELLAPSKRKRNVDWCNAFYFAVPVGLLTLEELAWEEPEWPEEAFTRVRCPNKPHYNTRAKCAEQVPVPEVLPANGYASYYRSGGDGWTTIPCRTCKGRGYIEKARVEQEAPTLWVPRDVGLVLVDGRGTRIAKKAPTRKDVPALSAAELGQLVRWISMRPDPRHASSRARRERVAA